MKKKPLFSAVAPTLELATQTHEGTPRYGDYGHPSANPVPTTPPDVRAAAGTVFDLRNEQTTLQLTH